MATETKCQTPGAQFHTKVQFNSVEVKVDMPFELKLSEEEATLLESNIHNAMELVLARYF